jgi:transposase
MSRAEVADIYCRSDRMVRLWIGKYNQGGIDALLTQPVGGRKRKVSLQRLDEVLVPELKDPAQAAIEPWTGVKVHGWLKK